MTNILEERMDNNSNDPTRTWIIREEIAAEVEVPASITDPYAAIDYVLDHDIEYVLSANVLERAAWPKEGEIDHPYNVEMLPSHMRDDILRYLREGKAGGGFQQTVLANDLVGSVEKADSINRVAIADGTWSSWLFNYCPTPAWGSREKVAAWMEQGGLEGRQATQQKEAKS